MTPELGVCRLKTIQHNVRMTTDVRDLTATENRVDYEPAAAGSRLRSWAVAGIASVGIWAVILWAVSELF